MTIQLFGEECSIVKSRYSNNRIALQAYDSIGIPMATLTVNLPEEDIKNDEVAIKDYAENQGVLNVLKQQKVVGETIRYVNSGFVSIPICKLLI